MMSMAPGAINTTGRGSSGVGLTAAVVVDKDTGERNLEAGAMVLADRGVVCIDEFDKMNEADRVAIHEVMEQQTVTIAKAGIHVSLNARCSVLAAANPIYGEYLDELSASKNIGLPDSLLSRFDLVFIVKDLSDEDRDKTVADRVIRNHMFPIDTPTLMNVFDDKIIEPEIYADDQQSAQVFEKYIESLHGKIRKEILTRSFLRKYLHYAKKAQAPALTEEAMEYIGQAWTNIRSSASKDDPEDTPTPVTVRTLETLIRLASAHAKLRLAKVINRKDAEVALEMYLTASNKETDNNIMKNIDIDAMEEDEPVHVKKSAIKNKKVSSAKKSKSSRMIEESNEDEESEDIKDEESEVISVKKSSPKKQAKKDASPKSSAKKSKRGKQEDEIEKIFAAKPVVTEERKRFVYKVLYDLTNRRVIPQVLLDDFWNVIQSHKDYNKDKLTKEDLLETLIALDKENKVLYSIKENEITII
jgi:DNA replication licensing factor MCM3